MAGEENRSRRGEDGKVSATDARQGVTNHGARYVLGISLVLVIVAFILAYLFVL